MNAALKINSNKKKGNVSYISSYKKRNRVKPYAKFDLDWQEILRADNSEKRISEAALILSARVAYELHKKNDRPVFLSSHWFEKATKKKRHQNARLRKQLDHIFHFKFHAKKFHDGELLFNVYEVWYTVESQKILNLEDATEQTETPHKVEQNRCTGSSKSAPGVEHKCDSYIVYKENIKPLKRVLLFSNNEKLKIKRNPLNDNAEPKPPPEESSLDDDSLATIDNNAKQEARNLVCNVDKESNVIHGVFGASRQSKDPALQSSEMPEITTETKENEAVQAMTDIEDSRIKLNHRIQKTFDLQMSELLQRNLEVNRLSENKIALRFRSQVELNDDSKGRLRRCLKDVYGPDIHLVMARRHTSTRMPQQEPRVTPAEGGGDCLQGGANWNLVKISLVEHYGKATVQALLQKLKIIEVGKKITFKGSSAFTEMFEQRFATSLRNTSAKHGLHFVFEGFCKATNQPMISEIKEESHNEE